MAESIPYASPRPPRRSDAAVLSAWCACVGVPPLIVFGLIFRLFNVPAAARWLEPFVPTIVLLCMTAMAVGLVCAIQSIAQREPRWRLAAMAGIACAVPFAFVAVGCMMQWSS